MSQSLPANPRRPIASRSAQLRIGTAGWAIPKPVAGAFSAGGSALERYASRFNAVEINSTFYRPHRPSTFARWVSSTPPDFRFSVKLPRSITHDARLIDCRDQVAAFRADTEHLQDKLGPLLVQLPPTLAFWPEAHEAFFAGLREVWPGPVVLEPRNASWFGPDAEAVMSAFHICRVVADPARHPAAARPGGWLGFAYWRLHGAPRMYYSSYEETILAMLAETLCSEPAPEIWCIFDNTASGAAAPNALDLQGLLAAKRDHHAP